MHRISGASIVPGCLALLLLFACATPGAAQSPQSWTDWARVRNVESGAEITVTTTLLARHDYRMAFADDSVLVLVRPLKRISTRVLDAMRHVGLNWPAILGDRILVMDGVRIWKGGVEEAGTRVASLEMLPRSAVLEVRRPRKADAASVLLDFAGVVAPLAQYSAAYTAEAQRRREVPNMPYLGMFEVNERPVNPRDIVYRTASGVFTPLDDAAWQRLLKGVPPSLRGRGGRSS
jgi:hypothetical protein